LGSSGCSPVFCDEVADGASDEVKRAAFDMFGFQCSSDLPNLKSRQVPQWFDVSALSLTHARDSL
jgi:hypothetical protein